MNIIILLFEKSFEEEEGKRLCVERIKWYYFFERKKRRKRFGCLKERELGKCGTFGECAVR